MKRTKVSLSIIALGICMVLAYMVYNYYAPPHPKQPYRLMPSKGDTLRIAYIGDSWAFLHSSHECQMAQMLEDTLHRPVKVYSYGICGLTSKEIYENILDDSDFIHFFQKHPYEACFVSAGINDTYKKMSARYYKESMDGIIQFLLANHIHPIILEIPDYDIQKAYKRQTITKKFLRRFSMFVNTTPLDCKQPYRNTFDQLVHQRGYANGISIIRYKAWNNNYTGNLNTLYTSDGMHLNARGYAVLDSMIATKICEQWLTCPKP